MTFWPGKTGVEPRGLQRETQREREGRGESADRVRLAVSLAYTNTLTRQVVTWDYQPHRRCAVAAMIWAKESRGEMEG